MLSLAPRQVVAEVIPEGAILVHVNSVIQSQGVQGWLFPEHERGTKGKLYEFTDIAAVASKLSGPFYPRRGPDRGRTLVSMLHPDEINFTDMGKLKRRIGSSKRIQQSSVSLFVSFFPSPSFTTLSPDTR